MTAGKKRELHELEAKLALVEAEPVPDQHQLMALREQIELLEKRIGAVPFIDSFDLRFRNFQKRPEPTSKAVMFCLMDVSGSMDQATKDMAKRFYILLYMFLSRSYKNVEVVYIRHHTQAKEVDEQEFFYSQETGGTIVSSALKMMADIVKDRYNPAEWNIYAAQASDGDNWADDSPQCADLLAQQILPFVRYYAYIEITPRPHQSLWLEYEKLQQSFDNFAIQPIRQVSRHLSCISRTFQKTGRLATDFRELLMSSVEQKQPLSDGPDWSFELLGQYQAEIERVAKLYKLDTYPNQIEVITAEQMMDAYSSVGMPIGYNHWSYGKKFIQTEQNYKRGFMGLAYEIVINSNPCIAYLMEENTMTMQALVMAHACYGHNSFF